MLTKCCKLKNTSTSLKQLYCARVKYRLDKPLSVVWLLQVFELLEIFWFLLYYSEPDFLSVSLLCNIT